LLGSVGEAGGKFVKEGCRKGASAATSINQRVSDKGAPEELASATFLGNKNCDKWRQLDSLVFEGEDAMGWIGKVEHYFHLRGVQEEEKMEEVMVAMEGNRYLGFSGRKHATQTSLVLVSRMPSFKDSN